MGMFDNYKKTSTGIPSNRYRYIIKPEKNYIIVNGTCYNTFRIMFKYDENVSNISVTYHQADRLTFTKGEADLEIIEECKSFLVKCNLTPEETALFGNTNLDTFAQVKLNYRDKVIFGTKQPIIVIPTIEGESDYEEHM